MYFVAQIIEGFYVIIQESSVKCIIRDRGARNNELASPALSGRCLADCLFFTLQRRQVIW